MNEVGFRSERVSLVDTSSGVIEIGLDAIGPILFNLIADLLQRPPILPLVGTFPQRSPGFYEPWAQAYSFSPFTLRLLCITFLLVSDAEMIVAKRAIGCILQGQLKRGDGLVRLILMYLNLAFQYQSFR